ncbi:MAG: glycosyl hydrolase [Acidobacteria bacterium]|nr:MAG: glycosyl hydrolase [Acidobacteriota bacterium]
MRIRTTSTCLLISRPAYLGESWGVNTMGNTMNLLLTLLFACAAVAQTWVQQQSGTPASLRGVSAVTANVVWASGSKGTYLRTSDGGATWRTATVPGSADLDFRAIHAVDERTAYLLSIGPGEKSRIYKTTDAGDHWVVAYTNPDPKGFFDALAFWDATHGIVLGDPVDGRFVILTTADGGASWRRRKTPSAADNEGAFAASNTCLVVRGAREAWFATGGVGGARVFHSTDGGETWSVAKTPVRSGSSSEGIFSLAFSDGRHGIAVGGDYNKTAETAGNVAVTSDGGRTWTAPAGTPPGGFRSAVAYLGDRKIWIATGTSGSDVSFDDGKNWKQFDTGSYNAMSFISSQAGWAVGPKGVVAKFKPE